MPGPPPLPPIPMPAWIGGRLGHPAPGETGSGSGGATAPATVEVKYNDGITLKGPQDFVDKTKAHLDKIATTTTGDALLKSLAASGKMTTIVPTTGGNAAPPANWKGALAKDSEMKWTDSSGTERSIKGEGTGSDTTVKYNPDRTSIGSEDWMKRPPEIGLAHELIHADDAAHGKMDGTSKDGIYNYERQAVGLDPYKDKALTENKIRAEWDPKQPERPRY
jgi:NleD-like pathogen effector protein (putative zinc metallopeptidase)